MCGLNIIKYLRVSVTTSCNENCWYCFNEGQPFNHAELNDLDGFKWFINLLVSEYGTEIIRFTGGEPLTNPNILNFICIAKNSGVQKIGLTTNGTLLQKYYEQLAVSGLDMCAVHLNQFDKSKPVNMAKIKDFINEIVAKFNKVKFNIVLTKHNKHYVLEIISYAIINKINLLILDLLQAGVTDDDFEDSYCSLDEIRKILIENGLIEKVENINSKFYSGSGSNIKLIDHYSNYKLRSSYCTRALEYNPLLLTPNFDLTVCTHFGKQSFSILSAVLNKDKYELRDIIHSAKEYLIICAECAQKVVLTSTL